MIEVQITNAMREVAHDMSSEMGILKRSITRGQGNVYGFLGELVALDVLDGLHQNTMDYDIIVDGYKIDVKTKKTTVKPKPDYDCSVADLTRKQNCDFYAFVRVLSDQSVGWFLGVKKAEQYFKDARYIKKGDYDNSNGFTARANCYNMPISELEIDLPSSFRHKTVKSELSAG
jgi:hypothetical protein|tara:strand:- start:206 stop:727 length:522 start_codon:yes stop_codon:yes gene_type:complete